MELVYEQVIDGAEHAGVRAQDGDRCAHHVLKANPEGGCIASQRFKLAVT